MEDIVENKSIVIPEDVTNPKEYLKWIAYKKNPILQQPRIVISTGEEINIAMLPHRLRKCIEHLAPKEQEDILEMKAKWININAKANTSKAMAYNRMGRYSGQEHKVRIVSIPFEDDVTELLGKMFTIPEVVRIMGEDNGVAMDEGDVKRVLKKNIVEIERRREEFRNKVVDVRLYNKRPRLDELAWMYSQMRTRYTTLNTMEAFNAMIRVLEQIRKESEGDVININGVLDINIEVEIQNHIQKEVLRTINLKEIILGRVAARMNWDLKKLVAGLHNSYYSKFVNLEGEFDPDAEMNYPSQQNYDFARIESNVRNEVEDVAAVDVTEQEKEKSNSIKNMFLSKIRAQKEELEKRQMNINAEVEIKSKAPNGEDEPIQRGRGRQHDELLNSKTKVTTSHKKQKDYFTGATINKKKKDRE